MAACLAMAGLTNDHLPLRPRNPRPHHAGRIHDPVPVRLPGMAPTRGFRRGRLVIFDEAAIAEALTHRCGLCKVPAHVPCFNVCTGEYLTDRLVHFYRIEPK